MSAKLALATAVFTPLWQMQRRLAASLQAASIHGGADPRVDSQRILMYHALGSTIPDDTQGRYTLQPAQFAAQMAQLHAAGVQTGRLGEPGARVAITFDDGYCDNLTHAYPVLQRLGLPFTIFVTPGFVRSGAALYLTPAQLRQLADDPLATIGAHGDSHARLTGLSDQALQQELVSSKAWLEDAIGKRVTTMSYPHGAVDARVRDAVRAAGFTTACCSEFGVNQPGRDRLALRRTDIWSSDSLEVFKAKLSGDWDWMRFFTMVGL